MDFDKKGKKNLSLNVVSNKEHKGFGAGTINLSQLSGLIIDGDKAYIDVGTLHAKSKVEKGIKFLTDKADVPNGRTCWIAWVAVDRDEEGNSYYAGATVCEMLIDEEAKRGWKILADHVNKMDKALKRKFILDGIDDTEKTALRTALIEHNEEWWENSKDELKEGLKSEK
ncbi:YwhD family protein [Chengkuizengella axinellae]|uniref:YwhD family protein n=1 Tax=Chengkuizengella axinellae TaxID=3064388 RepID=A0ABT9IZ89_9BACL|nr:YwhD family protein [Chengkuizengella sp. 2205SS18-9]MDP5274674.1 YwhD family protein [Chengkuizengella sp. 2205SS18-9]